MLFSIYFKIGYFKPIHSICFDLLRNLDKYSIIELASLTLNNILYSIIYSNDDKNKQVNTSTSIKQIIFSLPNFGFGMLNGPPLNTPFLPLIDSKYTYTLVLDLDETLVHFFYTPSGGTFLIRPYCMEFLNKLSDFYEIVIFTASMKEVSYFEFICNLI